MVDALESQLSASERVVYRLVSADGVVREQRGETTEKGSGDGGTVLAVTDRELLIVVDTGSGVETAEVPYTDLQTAEVTGSFLRRTFVVSLWGRGTLRITPQQSDELEEVAAFVSEASDVWQRAVAALQDARQYVADIPNRFESGGAEGTRQVRESAREHIETARQRASRAPEEVEPAIAERTESVERDLARARVEWRFERGQQLCRTVTERAEAADYDGACDTFQRACTHLEVALSLAEEWEFDEADRIDSEREALADRREWLEAQPLSRAEQALSRARDVDRPEAAVGAWEHALACYRDALTAGWGTGVDFHGDTDALRTQVAWLVGRVVRLRCRVAERYEDQGMTYEASGLERLGLDRYERACAHLFAAERLASQYRAGDAAAIRERLVWTMTLTTAF